LHILLLKFTVPKYSQNGGSPTEGMGDLN